MDNNLNDTMPPIAPSYAHALWTEEGNKYPGHYSEQDTLARLMDDVYKSRKEDIHVGQYPMEMSVEDACIVNGAIEIRARITPKSGVHLENGYSSESPHQSLYQPQPQPQPQYPHQSLYQPQYQYLSQPPYQPQYPYQSPYQPQYQYTYPYQIQYPYVNQATPPQFRYQFGGYPNQFLGQSYYQYPSTNVVGSIANAISQLAATSYLWRR